MSFGIRKRARRADQFVQIDNDFLRDETLSIEARGVGAYLLTHDASFRVSALFLGKATGLGRDKLRRVLKELEEQGYLVREHARDGGRFAEDEYSMSDEKAQVITSDWKTAAANQSLVTDTHKKTKKNTKSEEVSDGSADATESEDGTLPLPGLPAPAEPVKPEPKSPTPGQQVVAAYVDSYREQTGADPVKSLIGKVAGQTKRLIDDGAAVDALIEAATAMGHTEYTDLAFQLTRTLAARKAKAPAPRQTEEDVRAWLREQWELGRVGEITKRTGISWHLPDIPRDLPPGREALDKFTFEDRRRWIVENHERILETIARRTGR